MSLMHRRQHTISYHAAQKSVIPEWAELQRMNEAEAVALAAEHGIAANDRLEAITSLNNRRKEQSHENS